MDCAKRAHHNLSYFEGASKKMIHIKQHEEPVEFWRDLDMPVPICQTMRTHSIQQISPPNSQRLLQNVIYRINKNWNNWFLNLDEEFQIRSARSQKSILAYAERTDLQNKPAMFIYPYYQEPLFVLDLDDLTENVFSILCDKNEQKCYVWKGSIFEEIDDENGDLNLQEFVHLAVESFFETDDLNSIEYVFQKSGEESNQFLKYF